MSTLYELALMQERLDNEINRNHNLHTEDLYNKKKISLLVELGELANELRFFKFWSWNQTPDKEECGGCSGSGMNYIFDDCQECEGNGHTSKDTVLEEYIDCVHFILSICLKHHKYTDKYQLKSMLDHADPLHYNSLEEQFSNLFGEISNHMYTNLEYVVRLILGLGIMLGYTLGIIEKAYHEKYETNMNRQKERY